MTKTKKMFFINKSIKNMDSNDELKDIDIKDRACYYFHDII